MTLTRRVAALVAVYGALPALAGCDAIVGVRDLAPGKDGGTDGALVADSGDARPPRDSTTRDAADTGAGDASPPRDSTTRDVVDTGAGDSAVAADARDGTARDSGTSSDAADASTCPGGCCTLYVSKLTGNDANSGCSPGQAMSTIGTALALAGTSSNVTEVRVCGGTYPELNLALTFPVTLLGGYSCTSWKRAANYGYPSFASNGATVIGPSTSASQGGTTFTIGPVSQPDGGVLDAGAPSFMVDGFTIDGPTTTTTASDAVVIQGPVAGLTLSNNQIIGGTYNGTTALNTGYTRALFISGDAAVDVTRNLIDFGTSPSPTGGGTIGMWVTAGASLVPHIHENTVTGGLSSTSAPAGSVGLWIRGPNPAGPVGHFTAAAGTAVEHNVVSGGISTNGVTDSSEGIHLNGAGFGLAVDLIGNEINGGTGSASSGGNASAVGVNVNSVASLTITGNRVFGGTSSTPAGTVAGLTLANVNSLTMTNNLIAGGETLPTSTSGAASATGVACTACSDLTIADNTIFAGSYSQGGASAYDIRLATSPGARILGNILIGADNPSAATDVAIALDTCASIGRVANNLFVNQASNETLAAGACADGGATTSTDISSLEADVAGSANIQLATHCSAADVAAAPPACLVTTGCPGSLCPAGLLETFGFYEYQAVDIPTTDAGGVWDLTAADSCRVTQGGLVLAGGDGGVSVPTDIAGAARPSQSPSIGAWQWSGGCSSP